jgi:hypothetical protein
MNGSSRFYKGRKFPLEEALKLASTNSGHLSAKTSTLGKPTEDVRVVSPTAISKSTPKSSRPAVRPKVFNGGGIIRTIRAIAPNAGLPWVPGPSKKRKAKVQPDKAKVQPDKLKVQWGKKANTSRVPSRKILVHEGQPRFEGGIRFVQGGLPYLGKR